MYQRVRRMSRRLARIGENGSTRDSRVSMFKRLGISAEPQEIWNYVKKEKPILPFFIPVILMAWLLERWLIHFSNWVPLCFTLWATIQYGKHRQERIVEELNAKWRRHFLCSQPTTPVESCEWFNKMLLHIWPNYIERKLSIRFLALVQKRIKDKKPRQIKTIDVQEFHLGASPPIVGLQRTYWSNDSGQPVLHMGFEWDTNDMSVLLAAKLGAPFAGKVARIVVNNIHIKGDLKLLPILDGQALLYSFESTPEVRLGIAFGSGNQSLPATELPVVSSWLEKLLIETINRTMVEPHRRCFSLPAVDLRKHAIGGLLSVTVVSGTIYARSGHSSKGLGVEQCNGTRNSGSSSLESGSTFVELTLGSLTRKTESRSGSSPKWNETIDMLFHENSVVLHLHVYEQVPNSMKCNFLGSCEVKIKYVADDTTTYWAIGDAASVIAHTAVLGEEVEIKLPLEDNNKGELTLKLNVKEWQYTGDSKSLLNQGSGSLIPQILGEWPIFSLTGRKIKVAVMEGRNLVAKDRTGKSDPYVKLHYGKISRKTKTIPQNLNPIWNEEFEFDESAEEDYLRMKCYDADILMNDENMGSARINLSGLEVGTTKELWVPLEKVNKGEIRLKLEVTEPEVCEQVGSIDEKIVTLGGALLEVVVVEARDLVAADWGGTSDPYVNVRYGSVKKRTKVHYKTLTPHWNEMLKFIDNGSSLVLYVKDYNAILPAASIGHCEVEYQRLPFDETVDNWIPLKNVAKGQIRVQITRRKRIPSQIQKLGANTPLEKSFEKVGSLISRSIELVEEDNEKEELMNKLEELKLAEAEQERLLCQLRFEKDLLLAKVKELQQVMKGVDFLSKKS